MARIDQYKVGFRAPLGFAVAVADRETAFAVGLDADGKIQKGAAQTGIVGVFISNEARNVGEIVDVMQQGEIVEWKVDGTAAGAASTAGSVHYGAATGAISKTNTGKAIGVTVEATRLIVSVAVGATIDSIGAS